MTTTAAQPRARDDLETALCDDELLVFDRLTLTLHRLNATAALVLTHLDGATTPDDLAADLADHFGADPTEVRADVDTIVRRFATDGLLAGREPEPSPARERNRDLEPATGTWARRYVTMVAERDWPVRGGPYRAGRDRFWVASDDVEVGGYLTDVLAPLREEGAEPEPADGDRWYVVRRPSGAHLRWRNTFDAERAGHHGEARHAVENVLFHVNRLAARPGPHTVFHAAAAALDGHGVLLPARMDSGKSTTVTALVQDGFAYLSDEAVALTDDGLLLPFPKAIGLDPGSFPLYPELAPTEGTLAAELQTGRWQIHPGRLSETWRTGPVPLTRVVSPQYQADAETHLEPLSVADALVLLLEQTFTLVDRPGALQDLADRLAALPRHRLVIGDLAGARRLVAELMTGAHD